MKRKSLFTTMKITATASLLALSVAIFPACNSNSTEESTMSSIKDKEIPALLDRKGELAKATEWEKTKTKVAELADRITKTPKDVKPLLQLAMIYMTEGRITGNSYYNQATVKILDGILAIDPNNFEANTFKASEAMSLHQFAKAKQLAEKARSINPDNAYVYGVLVDANVELGNYREAIAMSDKMQTLKPSLEAYSRASYLREIFGQNEAAKQAMMLAVQAGLPGSESAEWARVQLGDLYLNTGQLDSAKNQYETALSIRPSFPNAEIGLAKVAKAQKDYTTAIQHTENAIRIVSESAYVAQLGELYALKGDNEKAKEIREQVVELLEDAEKEQGEVLMQHNANRELANAYLNSGNLDKAMQYAQNDLTLRPENIDANELAGWISYLKGDYAKAKINADKMLATHTKNATTLYKAGMIYTHTGDVAKGTALTQEAKTINPYIDQRILLASK